MKLPRFSRLILNVLILCCIVDMIVFIVELSLINIHIYVCIGACV